MKDETKHIIAKEVYSFFWHLILGGIPFLLFIVIEALLWYLFRIGIPYKIEEPIGNSLLILWGFVLVAPYIHRIYKWVIKWK